MEITTIHLMRHGEVDNPQGVLYGRLPGFALTPLGQEMARRAADALRSEGRDVAAVIASPLLRAQLSAAPSAHAFGLSVRTDARLIEAGSLLQGQRLHSEWMRLAHPRYWRLFRDPLRPSWGEPYRDMARRMSAAVAAALRLARGHEALLVSHQLPIVTLRRFVQGRPLAHNPLTRQCALGSLTSFTFVGATLVGISYREPSADLAARARDVVSHPGIAGAAASG